jgi:probable rRNA maturation factor
MISLEIQKKFSGLASEETITKYIQGILAQLNKDEEEADLSVFIGSDAQLKNLNRQFRGFDETTDVLSFESGEIDPETGHRYLGDIAISIQAAERQSLEAGHPLQNEIVLLMTHAILHLLGYDHNTPSEKKAMWEKQQAVINSLNIKINRISGDEYFHD